MSNTGLEAELPAGKGYVDRLTAYCDKVLKIDPDNFYGHGLLATASLVNKEFGKALEYASKALAGDTGKVPPFLREWLDMALFMIYEMLGREVSAKEVLERIAAAREGDMVRIYNWIAHSYFTMRIFEKAEYYNEKVMELLPDEPGVYYDFARIYMARGKPEKAREALMKARALTGRRRKGKTMERRIRRLYVGT